MSNSKKESTFYLTAYMSSLSFDDLHWQRRVLKRDTPSLSLNRVVHVNFYTVLVLLIAPVSGRNTSFPRSSYNLSPRIFLKENTCFVLIVWETIFLKSARYFKTIFFNLHHSRYALIKKITFWLSKFFRIPLTPYAAANAFFGGNQTLLFFYI